MKKLFQKLKNKFNPSIDFKLKLLLGIYTSSIIAANIFGTKIWEIKYPLFLQNILKPLDNLNFTFGEQVIIPFSSQSLSFSVGLFVLPITFIITDAVVEVKGKKAAKQIFKIALFCLTFVLFYSALAVNLPPATRFNKEAYPGAGFNAVDAYNFIFGSSIRIMIASLSAFAVSQFFDIIIFNKLKEKTEGKYFWLRNNLSTIFSQFIDTAVFYLIAFTRLPFAIPFLGIEANSGLDFDFMLKIFIPYYILKIVFSLLDTPLAYFLVWWLRKSKT
jgi:uncharacterized integral membrane protein (TIGR00697 family)